MKYAKNELSFTPEDLLLSIDQFAEIYLKPVMTEQAKKIRKAIKESRKQTKH